MSNLSGYDGEAVGFDSVSAKKRSEANMSTQTSEWGEGGTGTQTGGSRDCGTNTATVDDPRERREAAPPGLNEFLRRVVPAVLRQLDEGRASPDEDSDEDEDEDEPLAARQVQRLRASETRGGGDRPRAVLALAWSRAGTCLAVSLGSLAHEHWCTHDGLVRLYRGDPLEHAFDVRERSCVTALRFHPSVVSLLAYGTAAGDVAALDVRAAAGAGEGADATLAAPGGHDARRVSALRWAGAALADAFLGGRPRARAGAGAGGARVLVSAACDGSMRVWRVDADAREVEPLLALDVRGSRKGPAPDITCFDFVEQCPLRPSEERLADDTLVAGTRSGALLVCGARGGAGAGAERGQGLEGHAASVLDVSFTWHRPGVFVSVSIDAELRVYDVRQASPLQVFHLESPVSCVGWLASSPGVAVLGLAAPSGGLAVFDASSGRRLPVDGLAGDAVCALDVNQSGCGRVASGETEGEVRVWELPARRLLSVSSQLF